MAPILGPRRNAGQIIEVPVNDAIPLANQGLKYDSVNGEWKSAHPTIIAGALAANFYLTKDNNGVERYFFKDTFSDNTIANYTLSGTSPSIAAGIMSVPATGQAYHTITAGTTGKWDGVVEFTAAGAGTAKLLLGDAGTSYVIVTRIVTTNRIWLQLYIGGVSKIANTDTTVTLADSTFARVSAVYDGTSWQMSWNDTAVGANTASITVTTPIIGVAAATIASAWDEITFSPSVAFTDSFATDTSTRYAQVSGTVAYGGAGILSLTAAANAKVSERLRSYKFKSGNRLKQLTLPATCHTGDYVNIKLGATGDLLLGYGVGVIRQADTTWHICTVKDVTVTDTGTEVTGLADNQAFYVDVDWCSECGVIYGYVYKTTKPTAPQVTLFDATYQYGYTGVVGFASAGNGSKIFQLNSTVIRANLLIGETNIPATESSWYFKDEFTVDDIGRLYQGAGTWSVTAGGLKCTSSGLVRFPFFYTAYGTHQFTPTFADGYNHYYFSGYQIRFYQVSATQCQMSLESGTTGLPIGSGTITVTTSGGAFSSPVVIVETASTLSITVAGSTGSIVPPATSEYMNTRPAFGGITNSIFDDYSFSGTRYYMKPMLRGAQIGEYYNGAATVQATRFTDDFNWDTSAEYGGADKASWTWDTTNGRLSVSTTSKQVWIQNQYTDFVYETIYYSSAITPSAALYVSFRSSAFDSGDSGAGTRYNLFIAPYGDSFQVRKYVGGSLITTYTPDAYTFAANIIYKIKVVCIGNNIKTYIAPTGSEYVMIHNITDSSSPLLSGYLGYGTYITGGKTIYILGTYVNGLDTTSTNGISASLGGVPHGARYDTQEEVYTTFTNPITNGEFLFQSRAKSTYPAGANFEYYFINTTDSTAINWEGQTITSLTPGTTYADGSCRALLRYQDVGDTIKLSVRRKNYTTVADDNQPAVFVDHLAFTPLWMVD